MHHEADVDRDLDRLTELLPERLRADWIVVPRSLPNHAALIGLLLGASGALLVVAFALDVPALKWAFPLVLVSLWLAGRFLPRWRGDRYVGQMREELARQDE